MIQRSASAFACIGMLLASLMAGSGVARAQVSPALDRASLWIGGFDARSETLLRARAPDGSLSGDVNLEDDLGFPRRDWTRRLRGQVLVGEHQGLSFDFFRYRRSNATTLARRLIYHGVTYDAHARVNGALGFDFGSAAYHWWLGRGDDVVGIGLGAGYYRVLASIRGQASVNGYSEVAVSSINDHAWAPLLQLAWRHAFGRRWRVYLNASGVKKNGGRLHGHAYRTALGLQWMPGRHWGLGAEYELQRIRLWQHHARYDDSLDLKLDGPSLYATWRF